MNQVSREIFRGKICKFYDESQNATNFGPLSVSNKFRTQVGCAGKKLVNDVGNAGVADSPMAKTMQCAFATRIVWNHQKPFQVDENLRIEFRSFGQIWATANPQKVPPHIARAVKRVRAVFVKVRKLRRTTRSHDLLKKRDERVQGAKSHCQSNAWFDERKHEIGATVTDKIPKALVELRVGECFQQFARTLKGISDEAKITFGIVFPLRSVGFPMPSGFSDRMVEDVGNPVGQ